MKLHYKPGEFPTKDAEQVHMPVKGGGRGQCVTAWVYQGGHFLWHPGTSNLPAGWYDAQELFTWRQAQPKE